MPYTLRNAAEQFFAARAPAGFYGNAHSTFSKGIAAMRDTTQSDDDDTARIQADASFAYDCTLALVKNRRINARPRDSIVAAHPGFRLLRTLQPDECF